GTVPLALAFGAGANSRRSIGTTVVGGMCAATLLIIVIPVFFIMVEKVRERFSGRVREEIESGDHSNLHGDGAEEAGSRTSGENETTNKTDERGTDAEVPEQETEPTERDDPGSSDSENGPAKG
ncbi:MAG: efflux RND transporter permease subunit, partial [Mariniblastus sp.]|nr:efflux RND transporter permease subunit [Mariniblastus sp.]